MNPQELFAEFERGFKNRKFSAGLLVALIDLMKSLGTPWQGFRNFDDLLLTYPRQTKTSAGKPANTLIVVRKDQSTVSLRPFYNEIERFFRAEHKRFDYPSCAPHATQAWPDYRDWLDALATFSEPDLEDLRQRVCDHVLTALPSQAFDPSSVKLEAPLFHLLLDKFDLTAQTGEKTGAAFQGMVFGFLRADNPHLQIEIEKVRTGSKRLQRVGDIDCWEGARLAITAEVKQYEISAEDVPSLHGFANAATVRGALTIVAALGFTDQAKNQLSELGVRSIDRHDLLRIVDLWDPLKQRTAVASLIYYAQHVEKNHAFASRIAAFIAQAQGAVEP